MKLWHHIEPLISRSGSKDRHLIMHAVEHENASFRRKARTAHDKGSRLAKRLIPNTDDEFISFKSDAAAQEKPRLSTTEPQAPRAFEWMPVSLPVAVGTAVRTDQGCDGRVQCVFGDGVAYLVELNDGRVVRRSPQNLKVVAGGAPS